MDLNTLKELVSFLFDVKPEVRMVAASHLLSVTGSDEGLRTLSSDEKLLADIADNLARSLGGSQEVRMDLLLVVLHNASKRGVLFFSLGKSLSRLPCRLW
jgi:hypothetical protein